MKICTYTALNQAAFYLQVVKCWGVYVVIVMFRMMFMVRNEIRVFQKKKHTHIKLGSPQIKGRVGGRED